MTTIVPNWAVTDVRQSGNFNAGRARALDAIVIHHWGVDGQRHQDVVNFLCNANRPNRTSAHYVVSAGRATQIVSDRDTAWHCPNWNARGIGIECHPEMTAADFEQVATVVAAIRSEHGHLPLSGHQDHYPTACPGRWESQLGRLSARADAILAAHNAGKSAPATTATAHTAPKATAPAHKAPAVAKTKTDKQNMLNVNGIQGGATQARFEQVMGVAINGKDEAHEPAFMGLQKYLNKKVSKKDIKNLTGKDQLDVDGIAGKGTWQVFQYWAYNAHKDVVAKYAPGWGIWKFADGIGGVVTIKVLQHMLNYSWASSGKLMER